MHRQLTDLDQMEPSLAVIWHLSGILFTIGAVGVIFKRNALGMFMCIELMLNAVNLTFVAFSRYYADVTGQLFVFMVMSVAAAEAASAWGSSSRSSATASRSMSTMRAF